jgi:5'-3' exonuclease
MGIKNFSKVFTESRVIKIKDLSKKRVAIDSMTEIYRSALGAKAVKTLTDHYGNPTMHLSVILANLIEMQSVGIVMTWVFDHDQNSDSNADFHNPAKLGELLKRKARKKAAQDRINALRETTDAEEVMFSDSDEQDDSADEYDDVIVENKHQNEIDRLEKQEFSATKAMVNDIKLLLNCLNITYVEAPAGYEGEQIASNMAEEGLVDGVYSGDTDPIPFGSPVLWRRARDKSVYEYEQTELLQQITDGSSEIEDATMDDLLKVCLALGCDFAQKTPGIGPKTVLRKLHTFELTDEQLEFGKTSFENKCPIDNLVFHNKDAVPFTNCNASDLITWLTDERSFTKTRVHNWLNKVMDTDSDGNTTAKPFSQKKIKKIVKKSKIVKAPLKKIKKIVKKSKIVKAPLPDSDSDSDSDLYLPPKKGAPNPFKKPPPN